MLPENALHVHIVRIALRRICRREFCDFYRIIFSVECVFDLALLIKIVYELKERKWFSLNWKNLRVIWTRTVLVSVQADAFSCKLLTWLSFRPWFQESRVRIPLWVELYSFSFLNLCCKKCKSFSLHLMCVSTAGIILARWCGWYFLQFDTIVGLLTVYYVS